MLFHQNLSKIDAGEVEILQRMWQVKRRNNGLCSWIEPILIEAPTIDIDATVIHRNQCVFIGLVSDPIRLKNEFIVPNIDVIWPSIDMVSPQVTSFATQINSRDFIGLSSWLGSWRTSLGSQVTFKLLDLLMSSFDVQVIYLDSMVTSLSIKVSSLGLKWPY